MLSLDQYQQINTSKCDSFFERMIHFVSVIENEDQSYIEQLNSDDLISRFNKLKSKLTVTNEYKKTIKIGGVELHLIDFRFLKFGQFIDLEEFTSDDYLGNLHLIASCLYLQQEKKPLCEPVIEPIDKIDKHKRGQLIKDLPASSVLGACNKYLEFRKNFFNSYSVFQSDLEDVDIDELDEDELEEYNKEKEDLEKGRKDQWMRMLNTLSNEDATKFEYYLNMNLHLVFNQFSIIISKNKSGQK